MAIHTLLGLQWGDEGKGKIVDFLAPQYEVVARFQGGPNAGHTLEFDNKKFVLHQIPSGIFREDVINIIGNGLVLDAIVLKKEIINLENQGVNLRKNLFISSKAHLILPSHKLLDAALENQKGDKKIGSTQRGIGPTYQDKTGRLGLRVGDILRPEYQQKYQNLVEKHTQDLKNLGVENPEINQKEFDEAIDFLKQLNITNTEYLLSDLIKQGKNILAEGAQGTLLDVDFGSYPFVTSSNTITAGALTGLGVAPQHIKETLGIFKAYCTRVGSGPFPTEQDNEIGEKIRQIGKEFGATTGRKRRCGWLDLPALKYAIMLNGVTKLLMMKSDVLNDFAEIPICTHYELENGEITDRLPYCLISEPVKPIYKVMKGWQKDLTNLTKVDELPQNLLDYIAFIEKELEVPITLVSIGPDRKETILR